MYILILKYVWKNWNMLYSRYLLFYISSVHVTQLKLQYTIGNQCLINMLYEIWMVQEWRD